MRRQNEFKLSGLYLAFRLCLSLRSLSSPFASLSPFENLTLKIIRARTTKIENWKHTDCCCCVRERAFAYHYNKQSVSEGKHSFPATRLRLYTVDNLHIDIDAIATAVLDLLVETTKCQIEKRTRVESKLPPRLPLLILPRHPLQLHQHLEIHPQNKINLHPLKT